MKRVPYGHLPGFVLAIIIGMSSYTSYGASYGHVKVSVIDVLSKPAVYNKNRVEYVSQQVENLRKPVVYFNKDATHPSYPVQYKHERVKYHSQSGFLKFDLSLKPASLALPKNGEKGIIILPAIFSEIKSIETENNYVSVKKNPDGKLLVITPRFRNSAVGAVEEIKITTHNHTTYSVYVKNLGTDYNIADIRPKTML